MRTRKLWVFLLAVAMALCLFAPTVSAQTDTPTPTEEPTATATMTATPTPTPAPEPLYIYNHQALRLVNVWVLAHVVYLIVIAFMCLSGRVTFILALPVVKMQTAAIVLLLLIVAYPLASRGHVQEGFITIGLIEFVFIPASLIYTAVAQGFLQAPWGGDRDD